MPKMSRAEIREAIFAHMRENGETKTLLFLDEQEIEELMLKHYFVLPKKNHPNKPHLVLCEVTLPKEDNQ